MRRLAPADLLDEAQRMLDETPAGTVSAWPRAAALLARQALEAALGELWAARAPGVERLSMRAQLNCVSGYVADAEVASDVAYVWHALSRATHHHPYELDPTREELASLVTAARRAVAAVSKAR